MIPREKRDGFAHQRLVVFPETIVSGTQQNPLLSGVFPTDIGYFPRACGHRRERRRGLDQAIFIYCTRGSGWCEIEGQRHAVHPGELLVVPPGMPHVYGAAGRSPWTIHWFHVQGSSVRPFLEELEISRHRPVVHVGEDAQLLSLFQEVIEGAERGYHSSQLVYTSQTLAHLLGAIVRCYQDGRPNQSPARDKIAGTIAYMKQHLDRPLTLDKLATMANLARSQYSALFKKQTASAPIGYFIKLRMERARRLLETTNASVKAVAADLGYEDPLYFSRIFRSVHGAPPQSIAAGAEVRRRKPRRAVSGGRPAAPGRR